MLNLFLLPLIIPTSKIPVHSTNLNNNNHMIQAQQLKILIYFFPCLFLTSYQTCGFRFIFFLPPDNNWDGTSSTTLPTLYLYT